MRAPVLRGFAWVRGFALQSAIPGKSKCPLVAVLCRTIRGKASTQWTIIWSRTSAQDPGYRATVTQPGSRWTVLP